MGTFWHSFSHSSILAFPPLLLLWPKALLLIPSAACNWHSHAFLSHLQGSLYPHTYPTHSANYWITQCACQSTTPPSWCRSRYSTSSSLAIVNRSLQPLKSRDLPAPCSLGWIFSDLSLNDPVCCFCLCCRLVQPCQSYSSWNGCYSSRSYSSEYWRNAFQNSNILL